MGNILPTFIVPRFAVVFWSVLIITLIAKPPEFFDDNNPREDAPIPWWLCGLIIAGIFTTFL